MKLLSNKINELKRNIDKSIRNLEQKRADRLSSDNELQVIDEEEYSIIRDLNACKKEYQNDFHKHKLLKSEILYLKELVRQEKLKVCHEFLSWYRREYGVVNTNIGINQGEVLDDAEQFEIMQNERITMNDPNSLSFMKATKKIKDQGKKKSHAIRKEM